MKKILLSFFIFALAFFVFSVSGVSAKVLTSQNGNITVAKGEVVNDDLFIGAASATIEGTVNGDVFIGAQTVRISGVINGNLHIGAQNVDLSGPVKGNVYIGAQTVNITSANIGGSVITGAQNVTISKSVIGGSVIAGAASLTIDSQVKRNVYAGTSMLTIGANAKIGKNIYYTAGVNQEATVDKGAVISGKIYKSVVEAPKKETAAIEKQAPKFVATAAVITAIISYIGALIIGLLYFKLFGKHLTQVTNIIARSFWRSLGIGFVVTVALIPALLILTLTIIGIPVAILAVIFFALYAYLAKIVVGSVFGNWIVGRANWKMSHFWAFALGLLIIYILKIIPIIGGLTGAVVLWTGVGALTTHLFSKSE